MAASDEPDELAGLTTQERKILALVAEGKTNKEIAAEVYLSDKTVKNYVSSILSKLNLARRAQAAAFVAKHRTPGGADAGPGSIVARRTSPGMAAWDRWPIRMGRSALAGWGMRRQHAGMDPTDACSRLPG